MSATTLINIHGLNICCQVTGSIGPAPDLVMIHGLGTSRFIWAAQAAVVSRHRRVLCLDLPGAGGSDDDPDGYSVPRWSEQILAVAEKVLGHRQPVVLVGHSMGTVTAIETAVTAPERVAGLVLIGMLTGPAPGLVERAGRVEADGHMRGVAEAVVAGQLTSALRETNPAVAALLRAMIEANRPGAYAGHCRSLKCFSVADKLAGLRVPTRLIVGDQDMVTPLSQHIAYQREIQGSELAVIAGAAHTPQIEQPNAVNAELFATLAQLSA